MQQTSRHRLPERHDRHKLVMIYLIALIQGHLYCSQFMDQERKHVLEKHLKLKRRNCQENGENCVMLSAMNFEYTNIVVE
jgi:hypothetical protein